MKLLCVIGTRPEAIKVAPIILAAKADPRFEPVVFCTGQHTDMVSDVFEQFGIMPDAWGEVRKDSVASRTADCLNSISHFADLCQPDWILGQGDTSTAVAASMAAFFRRTPFAHVEAGLRTEDVNSPFPEEYNRRVCSVGASLHCAPTERAAANLSEFENVVVTGNTVIDALRIITEASQPNDANHIVVTFHRRENHTAKASVEAAVETLARNNPDTDFIWPAHPNPNCQPRVEASNIKVIAPLGYAEFSQLISSAKLIISDSGGIQEEAAFLGVPVVVLRETTERQEAVEAGLNVLAGTDSAKIISESSRLIGKRNPTSGIYGDGFASEAILEAILAVTQ